MNISLLDSLGHLSHNSSPTISTKVGISSKSRSKGHSILASFFLLKVQAGLLELSLLRSSWPASSWCPWDGGVSETEESK